MRLDVRLSRDVEQAIIAIPPNLEALTAVLSDIARLLGSDDAAKLEALEEELRAKKDELARALAATTTTNAPTGARGEQP